MSREVIIVGGGIAGLSAAVYAIQQGFKPILFEKTPHLGGRARSFYARDVDAEIDNGQHVLSNAYEHTRSLLKIVKSEDEIYFQSKLNINFLLPEGKWLPFKSLSLPSPFHFALALLTKPRFNILDRLALIRFFYHLKFTPEQRLRNMTVADWLRASHQTSALIEILWQPLTLATLNTAITDASAYLFKIVLEKAFLSSPKTCGLGLPLNFLSRIFAHPIRKYVEQNGGDILLAEGIKKLFLSGNRVVALETTHQRKIQIQNLILTIPPQNFENLLIDGSSKIKRFFSELNHFAFSPIITIHFWTAFPLPVQIPTALINSPIHWIFPRPKVASEEQYPGYTAVISDAGSLVNIPSIEIISLLEDTLQQFLGFTRKSEKEKNQIIKYKIIKEKRATVLQTPLFLKTRPSIVTPNANLLIAGDWVDTDLPATIESAVLSGKRAAEALTAI